VQSLSAEAFLRIVDAWVDREVRLGRSGIVDAYRIPSGRVTEVLQLAVAQENDHYYGLPDRSPIKCAACISYAVAEREPLHSSDNSRIEDVAVRLMARRDNASLAYFVGSYLVATAKFTSVSDVQPPFEMRLPSQHFRSEMIDYLAARKLSTPAIALLLELILYRGNGSKLRGRIDQVPTGINPVLK